MAEENSSCIMAQQNHKQTYKGEGGTGEYGYFYLSRKKKLWWLGHVWRMDKDRRANQVLHWIPEGRKRK